MILGKVSSFIRDHNLFAVGEPLVVAVSGGPDSVALLHILHSLPDYNVRLIVAHLNHCLRGNESDGDARFVHDLASRLGFPCVTESVDVRALGRERNLSLEDAGRQARREFLERVASGYGATMIALAHHRDDQAETVLLRLLRGAAGTGLRAMTPRGNGSPYVRPFLCLTRSEIIDYLQANGFEYRIDSSNSDKTILRNRVRHELLPYLETFNPAIASRLAVTAETLAADEAVLDDIVACRFTEICNVNGREVSFSVASLLKQERGIRFRLYRRALKVVKGDLLKISFNNLKAMEHLITTASPNAETYLPDGVVVRRQYEALVVTRQAGPSVPFVLTIEGPGRYEIPGVGVLHVYFGAEPQQLHCSSRQIYVDGDVAPFPWTVRNFLPGDRIVPLGFNGHKKVKELMMEHQVPRNRRSKIPLVFAGDELIWVAGIRRGAGGLITSSTTRVVVAILEEDEFSTHL